MADEYDFWEVTWRFDGPEFEALRAMGHEENYAAKQTIFSQGDPGDSMYLVVKGYALAVVKDASTGVERGTSIIPEGQSFGELSLLMGQPRTATVTAGTDLTVLKITLDTLKGLEQTQPASAAILYKKLARTLAEEVISRGF